jgi:predicted metal-binding protein
MPVQELILPALVRHKEQSSHLHLLVCEVCGTKAEFNPHEPGDCEQALHQLERHRCKNQ